MDLAQAMEGVAARLRTIDGLRVFAYPPDAATPPAAFVGYPDPLTFDLTYRRGFDHITLPVVVLAGKYTDRTTRDMLARYCAGSGPQSVRQVLETNLPAEFGELHVEPVVEFDQILVGGTNYMSAVFTVVISGAGE